MRLVIDTDIFIDYLRGYPPSKVWFKNLDWGNVLFSAITEAELLSGKDCFDDGIRKNTITLLQAGKKMLVTNEIAQKTGELRRTYTLPIMDAFIASTAVIHNAKVITRNVKDYSRIKGLEVEVPYL